MAKPQGYNKDNVKRWFGTLPLREQNALAQDLMQVVTGAKSQRIQELEAELADLKGNKVMSPAPTTRSASVVSRAPAKRASPLAGAKVPPKYADKSGNTWSGRGIHPKWLSEALAKGKKLNDFLIDKGKSK